MVIEHLRSAQGRPNPRGELHCFWCSNKTWTPAIGASDELKIIKDKVDLKKLTTSKYTEVRNSKKTNHQTLQWPIPKSPKKFLCMILSCY